MKIEHRVEHILSESGEILVGAYATKTARTVNVWANFAMRILSLTGCHDMLQMPN